MKSKLLPVLLSTTLMVQAGGVSVFAQDMAFESEPVTEQSDFQTESTVDAQADARVSVIKQGRLGTAQWVLTSDGVLEIGEGEFENHNYEFYWPWINYKQQIKKVKGTDHFVAKGDFSKAFSLGDIDLDSGTYRSAVEEIDLSGWDTSGLTSTSDMFTGCYFVKTIDLSSWDTSNLENTAFMFSECNALTEIRMDNWDTSNFTRVQSMFAGCASLEKLDLSKWNMSNAQNMGYMFYNCSSLKELDVANWDTSSATSMWEMFADCTKVENLDLSGWDVTGVKTMYCMFSGCRSLKNLDISGWDTRNTENIDFMFTATPELTNVKYNLNCANIPTNLLDREFKRWYVNGDGPYTIENLPLPEEGQIVELEKRELREEDKFDLADAVVDGFNASYKYTGKAIRPKVKVKVGKLVLSQDKDYTIEYTDNIQPGTASITVTGLKNYRGTQTVHFEIYDPNAPKLDLSNAQITGLEDSYTFTGEELAPEPVVTLDGSILELDKDYTLEYLNNINAGEATLTIRGKGECTGSKTVKFTIAPADLDGAEVSGIEESYIFTGSEITPSVSVALGGKTLQEGIDYTIAFENNHAVGTASYTITAQGNYTGTISGTFTITAASLENAQISGLDDAYMFTGEAITPDFDVMFGETILEKDTDYTVEYADNTNAGMASITITGIGTYSGTLTAQFEIQPADLAAAEVSNLEETYDYTGSEIAPEIAVTFNGAELEEGTDYAIAYENNVNVGTAKVIITGKGNYAGTIEKTFEIRKVDLSEATISGIAGAYPYTGEAIAPVPVVTLGEKVLEKDTDYTVAYENNVNVGTATITITGMGSYSGEVSVNFEIGKVDFHQAEISGIEYRYDFTGSAITPEPVVVLNGKTLAKGTDYTVSYANNINAGIATVTISGTGAYAGDQTVTFIIDKAALKDAEISGVEEHYTYTGEAITPEPVVKLGETELELNKDYTVSYARNTNAGTATLTIVGSGNYTGLRIVTFTIDKADLASAAISGIEESYAFTGEEIVPVPVVKLGDKTLSADDDYTVAYADNVNAGKASGTISGKGNYTGTKTVNFEIAALDLADAEVSGIEESYAFTGKEITPVPVVKAGANVLESGKDYTVSYANNTNAGEASVTISGKGNYTGTQTVKFAIAQGTVEKAEISGIAESYLYTGKAITPAPTVKVLDTVLEADKDYTVTYENNIEEGEARVLITGKGNYTGSILTTFEIVKNDISKAAVTGIEASYTFTGEEIKPTPTVTIGDTTLEADKDYTVAYANNIEEGVATVTITGTGIFKGEKTVTFKIVKNDLADAEISGIEASYPYTGTQIKPEPTVKMGGKVLEADTDYTVAYADNINAGTATVSISGKGIYKGSKTISFTIEQADLADAEITGFEKSYAYTAQDIKPDITVTLNGTKLSAEDYTVEYKDVRNAGEASIIVKGKGNYTGQTAASFTITPIALDEAEISGIEKVYAYTGKAITPKPVVAWSGNTLAEGTDYTLVYADNVNEGTASITISGKGNYSGARKVSFTIVKDQDEVNPITMHRLYNPNSSEHFYTSSVKEKDYLVSIGWKYEGTGWTAPEKSNTPVYRLYNKNAGDHHYTMDAKEKDGLVKLGWTYEGIGWYSDDDKGVPVYRQYNPNAKKAGSHNYTPNKTEHDYLVKNGWKDEGIGWYGIKVK